MGKEGFFITFEGGDGAGKSTLIDKIHGYLINLSNGFPPSASTKICDEVALVFPKVIAEGTIPLEKQEQDRAKLVDAERIKPITQVIKPKRDVIKTRAPGGTAIGNKIRDLLLHTHDFPLSARCELLLYLADRAQHVEQLILPALQQGNIVLCDRFNDSTLAYQGGARGLNTEVVKELCQFACSDLKPDLTLYLDLDPEVGLERIKKTGLAKDRIESETLQFHQNIRKTFKQIARNEPDRFIIIDASKTPDEVFTQAKEKIDAFFTTHRK